MSRIKEYPSITSFDGNNDALAIEQTDGASNRTRKVTPAQLKQYMEAGNFVATGEVEDGHGNILADMAKTLYINSTSFDIASKLPVGKSAAVIVSDSNLCTAFADDINSLSGVVSRLTNNVYAWFLVTYNYKFVYVRTDASFTVSRRFYAAGTSF